jgi:hypothetical protein
VLLQSGFRDTTRLKCGRAILCLNFETAGTKDFSVFSPQRRTNLYKHFSARVICFKDTNRIVQKDGRSDRKKDTAEYIYIYIYVCVCVCL